MVHRCPKRLSVMSTELRDIRMANAEQKAAALPPKLTVPMILFFLPALFIIILGPAGIRGIQCRCWWRIGLVIRPITARLEA